MDNLDQELVEGYSILRQIGGEVVNIPELPDGCSRQVLLYYAWKKVGSHGFNQYTAVFPLIVPQTDPETDMFDQTEGATLYICVEGDKPALKQLGLKHENAGIMMWTSEYDTDRVVLVR